MEKIIIENLKKTKEFAKNFAKTLIGKNIILLNGDLGAGKTTFTKYVLKYLGVKGDISSPTFTIMKEYKTKKFLIHHFDMYRISNSEEANDFGMEDYLYSDIPNLLTFIEWSDNIKDILPKNCIELDIKILDEFKREFILKR